MERVGGQEQRGAKRLLAERPELATVIATVEAVKGEKWAAFHDGTGTEGGIWCCTWGGSCAASACESWLLRQACRIAGWFRRM